ncbi:Uncharacterised protein [BD1-7 clade bacterium]|nr:Uncharacterised protein [BD1-7 clade bacterium]
MSDVEYSKKSFLCCKMLESPRCCSIDLKRLSGMPEDEFEKVSATLWDEGYLSRAREEGCCGRGCRFMCIFYMEQDRIWRLIEKG